MIKLLGIDVHASAGDPLVRIGITATDTDTDLPLAIEYASVLISDARELSIALSKACDTAAMHATRVDKLLTFGVSAPPPAAPKPVRPSVS